MQLPRSITSQGEAMGYLRLLHENELSYHPDDSVEDIDFGRFIPQEDRIHMDELMGQVREYMEPCEYLLRLASINQKKLPDYLGVSTGEGGFCIGDVFKGKVIRNTPDDLTLDGFPVYGIYQTFTSADGEIELKIIA